VIRKFGKKHNGSKIKEKLKGIMQEQQQQKKQL